MKIHTLSASKIKTFKQCEFKYYIEYHLALDTGTTFAAEQGSMIHVVFEKFGEAKRDGIDHPTIESTWYDEVLYAYREEELWKLSEKALVREKTCDGCGHFNSGDCQIAGKPIDTFAGCPKDEFADAIWLIEKVINDKTLQSPLNKKVVQVEQWFELEIDDNGEKIPVVGLMDIVTELDNDTIEVVDYKSGNYTQSYNECLKDPQLLIYHFAARRSYKNYRNILVTIYYLRKKPMTLAFSPADERATENALKKYWTLIKSNESPRRRCDKMNGRVEFDHVCRYMCDPELCEKTYAEFVKNGCIILPANEKKKEKKEWLKRLSEGSKPQMVNAPKPIIT